MIKLLLAATLIGSMQDYKTGDLVCTYDANLYELTVLFPLTNLTTCPARFTEKMDMVPSAIKRIR